MPLIQGFVRHVPPGLLVFAALLPLVVASAVLWGRSRASTTAASTNRILFAVVILLFAVALKLVSSGMDVVVFFVALVGLGVGCYGISSQPH